MRTTAVSRAKARTAAIAVPALLLLGIGLTACGDAPGAEPTPTAKPTEQAEQAAAATEVIELAPFTEDGELSEGWSLDESALTGGGSVSAEFCDTSEHGAGENTVSCGSTADATSACWLTERSTQIACLDEAAPEEQTLRLIPLSGPAPTGTAAAEEPIPLWLELEDGSVFVSVNGGAFSPPEGYLVAYTRVSGPGDDFEEVVVPDDDSAPVIDKSEDQWSVTVGVDGEESVETRQVERAWLLAGRTAPEPVASGVEIVNGDWCDAPQSQNGDGCLTIALPNYTIHATGQTWPFVHVTDPNPDGTIGLDVEGAPFGIYYPAGVPIPAEMLMGTADMPDQERIYSGQSGTMLIRG